MLGHMDGLSAFSSSIDGFSRKRRAPEANRSTVAAVRTNWRLLWLAGLAIPVEKPVHFSLERLGPPIFATCQVTVARFKNVSLRYVGALVGVHLYLPASIVLAFEAVQPCQVGCGQITVQYARDWVSRKSRHQYWVAVAFNAAAVKPVYMRGFTGVSLSHDFAPYRLKHQ